MPSAPAEALSELCRSSGSADEEAAASTPPFVTFDVCRTAAKIVDCIPLERRIVLLGECTHGTEEFYRTRAEITKRLIDERGFTAVVFEADWPMMQRVNDFTHRRRQTPFEETLNFPSWMWRNQCMQEFYTWCRDRPSSASVELFGMDCYSLFESKQLVVQFLEQHDPEFAVEVKERLAYIDKFSTPFEYADAVVHGNLKLIASYIQDCLTKIQARLQWGSDKYHCTPLERLSAEQNCEVVIAADEYYRKCVSEPAGSRASWNARDQHMTTTLMRIQNHLENPKIVVWAHNSHIGDVMATTKGGSAFERNEQWNLGQMVRATFGLDRTWIIGQYTYFGSVVASQKWDGPHENRPLRAALPESYEAALHKHVQPHVAEPRRDAFTFVTAPFADPSGNELMTLGSAASLFQAEAKIVRNAIASKNPVAIALHELLKSSSGMKLQRWVGVQYHPDTERQSHYGALDMAKCYDQVVFVDETNGLQPIQVASRTFDEPHVAAVTTRRLQKEYQRLLANPPANIEAHPLTTDILEWHFVIKMDTDPYAGGVYHGVLNFPPEYPQRPPSIRMLTPNGRFEPGVRLCLSMSDYHPESWNPTWSVETIIIGLQSFMHEESNAIGSIKSSAEERRRLAAAASAFNAKNGIFNELFSEEAGAVRKKRALAHGGVASADACESVCRFCFSSGGDLIAPCMCKGSNEWVHLECLRSWQKSVLLTQPTHPKYQTSIDRICNICLEPFTGEGIPPTRHEQILQYTGKELAALVKPGNLLVSSRDKSREYLELMQAHPEIKKNLAPWTTAVFLITASNAEHMMAVSMSMPLEGPPAAEVGVLKRALWARRASKASGYKLRFWDGGPVGREDPQCVVHLPNAGTILATLPLGTKVKMVPPHWLISFDYDELEAVVVAEVERRKKAAPSGAATQEPITLHVVWGFGGWGATQVLAEMARGGWGIVTADEYISARPDPTLEIDWTLDMEWARIMPLAKCAPSSEYSRVKGR